MTTLLPIRTRSERGAITVQDVVRFYRIHGRDVAAQWTDASLVEWIGYHAARGNLLVVADAGGEIAACGVGWRCDRAWIDEQSAADRALWTSGQPDGSCFYIAQVIVAEAKAWPVLVQAWHSRWPELPALEVWAHRARAGDPPTTRGGLRPISERVWRGFAKNDHEPALAT